MLLVNFIGEPGAGKSTMAAGLFHSLKTRSWNVELVTEYTKELILTGDQWKLADELLVFSEKYRRIRQLEKVDIVITDSPLINSIVYGERQFGPAGGAFFEKVADSFDSIYFAVRRVSAYVPYGRMPDEEDAEKAGRAIIQHLERITSDWGWIDGHDRALPELTQKVESAARDRGYAPFQKGE